MVRSKRPKWRVSLRSVLLIVTCFGTLLACFIQIGAPQRQAVAAIESIGGEVTYVSDLGPSKSASSWLVNFVGREYFEAPFSVVLKGKHVDDAIVHHIADLPSLRHVKFDNARVSNEALLQLGDMRFIDTLFCCRSRIDQNLIDALHQATRCEFEDFILMDAIAFWVESHNIRFRIDDKDLEAHDIDVNAILRPSVPLGTKIKLHNALDKVLDENGLGWILDGREVVIVSKSTADEMRAVEHSLRKSWANREVDVWIESPDLERSAP